MLKIVHLLTGGGQRAVPGAGGVVFQLPDVVLAAAPSPERLIRLGSFQPQVNEPAEGRKVSNIVMMGMGEPLYNFDSVKTALLIASDGDGLSLSKRRITLSTSGVVPEIYRTGDEIGVMLAISLHAVRDDLRDMLVPINKKYPLKELMDACRAYPGLSNARRITFEYVMLKGVNDSLEDAKGLIQLLKGIPAKINLIPFNPFPHSGYERPSSISMTPPVLCFHSATV